MVVVREKICGLAAKKDEIEITSEMIEAGVEEFQAFDNSYERPCDAVWNIYIAMEKARTLALDLAPSLNLESDKRRSKV